MLKWNRGVKPPSTAQTGRLGAVLFFLGLRPGSVLNDARRGCAPSSALLPMRRALRPSKGDGVRLCLTLLPDEKVTKESPRGGSPLGTPLGGALSSPQQRKRCSPQKGVPPYAAKLPGGCRRLFTSATNTARAESRGIKGGRSKSGTLLLPPPSPEVQEPGGSWRILGDFLFVRKSPGARGGAPASREE